MSAPSDQTTITEALATFQSSPLKVAATHLLNVLGYSSDRSLSGPDSSPQSFLDLFATGHAFDQSKALVSEWKSADLLFQLTDQELSRESSLFTDTSVNAGLLKSYVFIAIELTGKDYARGKFSAITRQINRLFPMPVMVVFRHQGLLTIAVINRRMHKLDENKDVLGKVTLIRDINFTQPHRGHLDILASLIFSNLVHPQKKPIIDFDTLHAAWEQIFNIELLNKNFYDELANWFFWAKKYAHFPLYDKKADRYDLFHESEKAKEHEAKNLIRLLTRTLFVWFIKERGLVPASFFSPADLKKTILKSFDSESTDTNYYKAVLQNLFFATLNQTHGEREFRKEGQHQNTTTLLRYRDRLTSPTAFVEALEYSTPFLNGGLFECLDRPHPTKKGPQDGKVIIYEDGFSDRKDNPLLLPDFLFFGKPRLEDLSGDDSFGLANKRNARVRGLIHILDSYKFTIVENTPIDQEIALDPELLGQVFENLLASYNEETKTTARKQTGSFYTPRPIVDYMVDESLKFHLTRALVEKADMKEADARAGLDLLFTYTEQEHPFKGNDLVVNTLIAAIDALKILDPACGSGAFPMGTLQKLVYILSRLDPRDELWERRQLAKVDRMIEAAHDIDDTTFRERAINEAQAQKQDIEEAFAKNELGYGRKLYLIENCLYGVDIQSIATQVTKLRFFISLIVDQKVDRGRENFGVRPLPNLETKFVTADSLIRVEKPKNQGELFEIAKVSSFQHELKQVRHSLFSAKTPRTKNKYRERDKELRDAIADELKENGWTSEDAERLAAWDPYDQNASAPYFDPEWMFGLKSFDIVIGNPPYISVERFAGTPQQAKWQKDYTTYAARGDIYCFFYERGVELLKDGGTLIYITSNKWMRAGYGERLRDLLSSKVNTEAVLDFGMAQNFGAATTYTCITRFVKEKPDGKVMSCYATDDRAAIGNPSGYFAENAVSQKNFTADPWIALSGVRLRIKKLVEEQGIPLENWDIQINYGIKTGFNKAYYLTAEQRNALIDEDPASDDLIGRLLRGRDVERYAVNWNGTYQLVIKFGAHEYLEERYPAVFRHLLQFEKHLKERGQCKYGRERKNKDADKKYSGQHHWLELDNNPSDENLKLFAAPKIMYPNMTKFLPFYFDDGGGYLTNDKGFIINSETQPLCYLTAFLNSHLFRCCFRDNFPELMGNTYEVRKIFVDKIPVKKPTAAEVSLFERLVPLIQFAKAQGQSAPSAFLEDLIDACVMECYFREHMAERDLLFHDLVAPHLAAYDPAASEEKQRDFLTHLHQTLNAPSHPIRNQLIRLTADSPDLLAVIKREGYV
jgi:type I restriction-modification system DNA methylase subunit